MKLFIASFLLFSGLALATECEKEAKKYCPGVDPGRGQIALCLSDYKDYLSPACSKELREHMLKTEQKNPCYTDLAQFCADLPADPLNYEYCLLKNESRLSTKCAADFKNKKGRIITRNVCAQDIAQHCYGELKEPEGAVTRCLIRNKAKLAGFCQKNIDKKIADYKKKNPCYDDTEKFCPTQVKFIDIQDCLSKKLPSLAKACKPLVQKELDKMKANACYRDLRTHCIPGLSPKEQSDCMTLNEEHLSQECKKFRAVEKTRIDNMVKACETDRLKFCKDVQPKDGAIAKCLRNNKASVSKNCQQYL